MEREGQNSKALEVPATRWDETVSIKTNEQKEIRGDTLK